MATQSTLTAPIPIPVPAAQRVTAVRLTPPDEDVRANLGLLKELEGSWHGRGFNLIGRPDKSGNANVYLELNVTRESLKFDAIGSSVPNRGFAQDDIELFGLTYLQKISDAQTGGALHIEPGIWVNVPPTGAPSETRSVARMGSIPHGNALLAEGVAISVASGPIINPVNTAPFAQGAPMPVGGTPSGFPAYTIANAPTAANPRTPFGDTPAIPLPADIDGVAIQDVVNDPTTLLRKDIEGQTIDEMVVLNIATQSSLNVTSGAVAVPNGGGGIENIPFLQTNADTALVFATFWIEKVKYDYGHFLQLQYVQTVMLNFPILNPNPPGPPVPFSWPHVSVATLRKSFD
jgi:hypothetical protein